MWLPTDHPLWQPFRYLEVARYRADRNAVIRELQKDWDGTLEPLVLTVDQIEPWRARRKNLGLYTSVWRYDNPQVAGALRVASLYFDLDDQPGNASALANVRTLVSYLENFISEEAIRIYFTGEKGFHVEVELVALGIGVVQGLAPLYRFIATGIKDLLDLTALDFHVYDSRRMWRLPNSEHQRSGLYKVPLSAAELELDWPGIWELALVPRPDVVPEQQFETAANEWLHDWMQKQAEEEGPRSGPIDVPKLTNTQAQSLLERQIRQICTAGTGGRNNTLNRASFILGKLVQGGLLPQDRVKTLLLDAALDAGLEEHESRRTISSGMTAAGRS